MAVADVNGDGKPDLVVANNNSDNVSVLLGNGTGTFGAADHLRRRHESHSVAVADVNGDGKPDLVVANYGSNNVSVLLGAVSAPTVTAPSNQTATEGAAKSFNLGSFSDPDGGPWTVDVNWGDNSAHTTFTAFSAGSLGTQSHTYADESATPYTVTIRVTDSTNLTNSATFTTTIADAPLTGSSAATATGGVEGATAATLANATFTDAAGSYGSASDFTVTAASWGDTSTSTAGLAVAGSNGSYTVTGSHLYAALGTYNFSLTVTDVGGQTATITGSTTVTNAAPSNVQVSLTSGIINENGSTTLNGSFTDPGPLDTHVVTVNWGDGSAPQPVSLAAGVLTFSVPHQYLQDGGDSISVSVADSHGGTSASVSTPVTVNNVAPSTVAINVSAATINENGSTTLSGSFVDPGTLDTHVVTINWGDGSVPQTVNLAAGVLTFSGVAHQYLQDGNDSVSVTVADDHATTAAVTTPVTVNNVAPSTVAINVSAATINENGSTTLSGSFVDPGTLDTHVVTINWGDGSAPQTVNLAAGVSTFSGVAHQYLQDGNDSVSVTVADDHATTAAVTTPVAVNNVAPSSVAINVSAATINENGSTTLSGSFIDPGTLDSHVVTINWGDGSLRKPSTWRPAS